MRMPPQADTITITPTIRDVFQCDECRNTKDCSELHEVIVINRSVMNGVLKKDLCVSCASSKGLFIG